MLNASSKDENRPKKNASLTVRYQHRPRNIFDRVFLGFLERRPADFKNLNRLCGERKRSHQSSAK